MAGLGSRFKKAGYSVPKYMIEVHGKSLFEWSMKSLSEFSSAEMKYFFIVRKEDQAQSYIKEQLLQLGIASYEIIEIDHLTDGQATTVMFASPFWKKAAPLFIYNIDTYVEEGEIKSGQIQGDGFIPCFNAPGDHWSFVKLDQSGKAIEVREKQRISDNCTLGAYYFKSCELYEQLYEEYYMDKSKYEGGEAYVAPLYNLLIQRGGSVFISHVATDKIHVLGTPEELDMFRRNYKKAGNNGF